MYTETQPPPMQQECQSDPISEAQQRFPHLAVYPVYLVFPPMYLKNTLIYDFLYSATIKTPGNHYIGTWYLGQPTSAVLSQSLTSGFK